MADANFSTHCFHIISRPAAKSRGLPRYFTGLPCKYGHIAERTTSGHMCTACRRRNVDSDSAWHQAARARAQAKANGQRTYISPKPCPKGHIGERYLAGGKCVACSHEYVRSEDKKRYDKAYYLANRELITEQTKKYRKDKSAQRVEYAREWARRNPERRRAIAENYKHRRRATEGDGVSTSELLRWKRAQKKVCYWCNANCRSKYHVDHYVPLSKGGTHTLDNLVIACPSCNYRKSAKDPIQFAAEVGRLF